MKMKVLKNLLRPVFYWGLHTCSACGARMRLIRHEIMWPELGEQWSLTPAQYLLMDKREGCKCPRCGCNWRVRHLAQCLLRDVANRFGIRSTSVKRLIASGGLDGIS